MQILYIDPSVMTYAIQAIAGIVIALGATIGIVWRKSKKKVSNIKILLFLFFVKKCRIV